MSTRSSSDRKRIAAPGRRMKRSTCGGSGSSAISGRRSSRRCSFRMVEKPPLGMNGKGCAGSMASGVRIGKTWSMKYWSSHVRSPSVSSPGSMTAMPASRSSSCRLAQHLLLVGHQDRGALADRHELLGRRHAVVAQQGRPGLQHVDQAGHADHVEFVEIVGRDRQEAHALEQRMALVAGLLEHAHVEGQPRQFAIDEALRTVGCYFERRSRAGGRGEGVHCRPLLGRLPELFTGTVTPLHDGVMAIQ